MKTFISFIVLALEELFQGPQDCSVDIEELTQALQKIDEIYTDLGGEG